MAKRNFSIKDIKSWKFKELTMPQEWVDHLGNLTENFRMLIVGKSGHGKTEYAMKLSKMLSQYFGKVSYNSTEQGRSASFQQSFFRNQMDEIKGGKWMLCDPSQRVFNVWFERLKKQNSGRVVLLDSLDYMKLTLDQFKLLHETFRHKSIIIVAWNDPIDPVTKKIRYMCDIKVEVENFSAKIASRFGGNKPFKIWDGQAIAGANDREAPKPKLVATTTTKASQELIRIEKIKYPDSGFIDVLIYEDQPEQLTEQAAVELFVQYPSVKEIHEVHDVWGGRWSRSILNEKSESHAS